MSLQSTKLWCRCQAWWIWKSAASSSSLKCSHFSQLFGYSKLVQTCHCYVDSLYEHWSISRPKNSVIKGINNQSWMHPTQDCRRFIPLWKVRTGCCSTWPTAWIDTWNVNWGASAVVWLVYSTSWSKSSVIRVVARSSNADGLHTASFCHEAELNWIVGKVYTKWDV